MHTLAYPGTILGLIFFTGLEIKLTIFIHLALALFFMASLLRSLRYSLLAAYLGGLVYALSGFAVSHLYAGHVDIITTCAFAPPVLWSIDRALRRRGAGWTGLGGLAFALMIISGHYQIIYLAAFCTGLLTMGRVLLGGSYAVPRLVWRAPWDRSEIDRDASADRIDEIQDYRLLALSRVPVRERVRDLCWWLARIGIAGGVAGLAVALIVWLLRAGGQAGPSSGGERGGFTGGAWAGPPQRRVPALLLVLLVGIDLVVFAQPYLTTEKRGRFELPGETEAFLKQHLGTARMLSAPQLRTLNGGESRGLSHFGGYDTIVSGRYNRAVNRAMGYEADRQLMVMSAFDYGPLWQIQGVRFLLSPYDLTTAPGRTQQAFADFRPLGRPAGVFVYENAVAFPRAFVVHGLYQAGSADEALAVVTSRPDLVRARAVVSAEDHAILNQALPVSDEAVNDLVTIESLTPNEVAIAAQLRAPGLVVLTD